MTLTRVHARFAGVAVAAVAVAAAVRPAAGATVVYSNLTTYSGMFRANGAATAVGTPAVDFTPLVADDITPATGNAGAPVTSVAFSLVNSGGTAASVNVELRFYAANGPNGGPGTILASLEAPAVTQPAGPLQTFSVASPTAAGFFALPASTFYAGIAFSDGGAATATAAQLAGFGQGLFNPPTVGSSLDSFFASTTTSTFNTSNPPGSLMFFNGNPVANFGWAFSVTPVPEPASVGATAAVAGLALARRRRRTAA